MTTACLALGSNLGDRAATLRSALGQLAETSGCSNLRPSSIYETAPVGPAGQDNYYNAVVLLETTLSPHALLDRCLEIEQAHGRIRRERWGPRTLDMDLLFHGTTRLHDERLTLPHPRMVERAFVMIPLCEVAPDLILSPYGVVREITKELDVAGVTLAALQF